MINTYNETSLHRSLKNMYCKQLNGKTEVDLEGYVCDIVCENGDIIEVQTKNVGSLTGKIANLLQNHRVTLIYPIPITTYVEYYKENHLDEKPISRKKSPVKKNLLNMFDEIMAYFPILLHPNFTFIAIEVCITKERIKTEKKVQSLNKKRRHLKDWISKDTTLDELFSTHIFCKASDYLSLLPKGVKEPFCVADLLKHTWFVKPSKQQVYKMIWTFNKMGIIEFVEKEGRSKMYRIVNN